MIPYLLCSYICHNNTYPCINNKSFINVVINLLMIELVYGCSVLFYTFPINSIYYNYINFLLILICQDIYFYTTHRLFHCYIYKKIHKLHHSKFGPFYGLYTHHLEHFIINIMSVAIPFMLFPTDLFTLQILIILQMYSVVVSHTYGSRHEIHHAFPKRRYGNFMYIPDNLLSTY